MTAQKIALLLSCTLIASSVRALPPDTKDPRAIMRAVYENNGAARSRGRMKMTIRDSTGSRERALQTRSLRFQGGRKTLLLIEAPADVRGTGFLSIDYEAGGRADEQWLYLPKLRRVTRVPASGRSDAFVGSDFSYADLSQQDPADYEFKLLSPSENVGGEDCWHIEALPKSRIAEETGYSKSHLWISKSKVMPLQVKSWMTNSARIKYFKASDLRQVDGVWTAHRLQMRSLDGQAVASETLIEVSEASNAAADVNDADFTQQRLERGL